jgi:SAM-dependent methyltransferase
VRAFIYDAAIARMTAGWYRAVIERLPEHARVLDVGIGTGRALLANAEALGAKDLHVTGIDIDADYVNRCRREVARRGLADRVQVRLESVYDHRGGPYAAVYFSASFMLLPEPARALRHVGGLLAPGGRVYFTQTFEDRPSRAVEIVKPLLRHVTTVDFGRVTYEADFRRALAEGGIELEELQVLSRGRRRSHVLAVGRPVPRRDGRA